MSKKEVPEDFLRNFVKSGGKGLSDEERPTKADIVSDTPTMSDNVNDTPTIADELELVRVTVRIDKRQRDRLERIARNQGRLLSDVVREAIRRFLEA